MAPICQYMNLMMTDNLHVHFNTTWVIYVLCGKEYSADIIYH